MKAFRAESRSVPNQSSVSRFHSKWTHWFSMVSNPKPKTDVNSQVMAMASGEPSWMLATSLMVHVAEQNCHRNGTCLRKLPVRVQLCKVLLSDTIWPHIATWLATPLKNISQLEWLFPIYGKIENVPNHQPATIVCHNVLILNPQYYTPAFYGPERVHPLHPRWFKWGVFLLKYSTFSHDECPKLVA